MTEGWNDIIKQFRLRHGLNQAQLAEMLGVSQRTISRWEIGQAVPSLAKQKQFRDIGWRPPTVLMKTLYHAVRHCPAPRALSRMPDINLQVLSVPALAKRPSMADYIGEDLRPLACGILEEILDDTMLQRDIRCDKVASLVTTTSSVLRSREHESIGVYRTTISYFRNDGDLYSDAISVPAEPGSSLGYEPVYF